MKIISVFPFSNVLKRMFEPPVSSSSSPPSSLPLPSSPPLPPEIMASISSGIAFIIFFCVFAVSAIHPAELYAASAVSILADISATFAASRLASFSASFVFAAFTALISAYLSGAFDVPSAELYFVTDILSTCAYSPAVFTSKTRPVKLVGLFKKPCSASGTAPREVPFIYIPTSFCTEFPSESVSCNTSLYLFHTVVFSVSGIEYPVAVPLLLR